MKWKVVCFSEHSQHCARSSPLRRWRRLSRFGAPHYRLRWRERVLRCLLPRPTSGCRLAGVGELRESLGDYVALGHAGCPESGLTSHGLAGDDMKALHLLNFEPRCCGRAEKPRNLRRDEGEISQISDVLHDAKWILCSTPRCHHGEGRRVVVEVEVVVVFRTCGYRSVFVDTPGRLKTSSGFRAPGSQTPGVPATWHSRPAERSAKNAAFLGRKCTSFRP